ncbi:hypothetical protein IQ270_11885 [Microcoleus sp. LEGE 07076]|uniref:hypothetical protein n=1 Tax=Microcoleus sp. LEGE 07076 TaxID=915322 RepID=UPI001882C5B4|nr:hypothetical protein [Microcoleus sp. LEGE 07076]MBE9185390.1 hypothetical protein [Microcoleus sp. LEGE 07076]
MAKVFTTNTLIRGLKAIALLRRVSNISSNSDELRFVGVVSLNPKGRAWEEKIIGIYLGASAVKILNEYKAIIDAEE